MFGIFCGRSAATVRTQIVIARIFRRIESHAFIDEQRHASRQDQRRRIRMTW